MGLETNVQGVDDLNPAWPISATDPVSEGSAHLREIKKAVQATTGGNGTYADLKYAAAVVVRTITAGASWLLSGIERGRITVTAASELFIEASSASGIVGLRAKDAAGTTRPIWVLTALAAGSQLYHAAGAVLTTLTNGVAIRSGAGVDPVLGFQTAAGVDRGNITAAAAGITVASLTGTAVNLGPAGVAPVVVGALTISAGTRTVQNVVNPTAAQDAATKAYTDSFTGGFKALAAGTLAAAGTVTKAKGCTVVKGAAGIWTITLTTALSAVANGLVQVTGIGASGTAVQINQAIITSTTSITLSTYQGGSTNTLTDKDVGFLVLDLGA